MSIPRFSFASQAAACWLAGRVRGRGAFGVNSSAGQLAPQPQAEPEKKIGRQKLKESQQDHLAKGRVQDFSRNLILIAEGGAEGFFGLRKVIDPCKKRKCRQGEGQSADDPPVGEAGDRFEKRGGCRHGTTLKDPTLRRAVFFS